MRIFTQWVKIFLASITFYTIFSFPSSWSLEFKGIARYASLIGLFLGLILGSTDLFLTLTGVPLLTRSALIVGLWVFLTGGLHLDGVMDAADGLAVSGDSQRRLEVMRDSVTGAFGVMAGICVIFFKFVGLTDLSSDRLLILMASAGWGRWGQMGAIALYPYLRKEGKGAIHQENLSPMADLLISFCFYIILSLVVLFLAPEKLNLILKMLGFGVTIALATGYYFAKQLGGHTGDTYGAVVEWTEAFFLCLLTIN